MRITELFDQKPKITKKRESGIGVDSGFSVIEKYFTINNIKYLCEIKIRHDIKFISLVFKSKNNRNDWTTALQGNQESPSKVFGAVIHILTPYATKYENYEIFFRSEESGSREKLYDVLASRLAKQFDRTVDIERHGTKGAGYTISPK